MAGFRKCVGEFLLDNNAYRLPEPVPSSSLPSRGRTASREHPEQCACQSVRFETVTNPDKRTKETEAQRKRQLSGNRFSLIEAGGSSTLTISVGLARIPCTVSRIW